jgi:hypothetical protein
MQDFLAHKLVCSSRIGGWIERMHHQFSETEPHGTLRVVKVGTLTTAE